MGASPFSWRRCAGCLLGLRPDASTIERMRGASAPITPHPCSSVTNTTPRFRTAKLAGAKPQPDTTCGSLEDQITIGRRDRKPRDKTGGAGALARTGTSLSCPGRPGIVQPPVVLDILDRRLVNGIENLLRARARMTEVREGSGAAAGRQRRQVELLALLVSRCGTSSRSSGRQTETYVLRGEPFCGGYLRNRPLPQPPVPSDAWFDEVDYGRMVIVAGRLYAGKRARSNLRRSASIRKSSRRRHLWSQRRARCRPRCCRAAGCRVARYPARGCPS